jgi:NAD(P)-dependent dehydrogenase (short-subunit alcohol dehydrogenase family)
MLFLWKTVIAMSKQKNALIIGSHGTIGAAIVDHLQGRYEVHELNRSTTGFNDQGLHEAALRLQDQLGGPQPFDLIICTVGFLSTDDISPEKKLSDINAVSLSVYFAVNAIIPALCLKHFAPLLNRESKTCFAVLSAMVGSISDNKLGGWYGYRSSKAALNMLIKTAAIELSRTLKKSTVVAIHPGTTISSLTKPFSKNIDKSKYYEPNLSASRIVAVCESLHNEDSGGLFNWDGKRINW